MRNFNIETVQPPSNVDQDPDVQQYFEQIPFLANEEYSDGTSFNRYSENVEYQNQESDEINEESAELFFLE